MRLRKSRRGKSNHNRDYTIFQNLLFKNVSVHSKTQNRRFRSPRRFEKRFRKAPCSLGIRADGRHHHLSFVLPLLWENRAISRLKVHLIPKYFFGLNKSLHRSETHCAFLPLLTQILTFYRPKKLRNLAITWFDVANFFACMFTKT